MYEVWTQVMEQVRGVWRFRWRAVLVAWLIALAGWTWVYSLPNVYAASARVYVDTHSVLEPLLKGLAPASDVMSQVNLMTRRLMSRPNLEKVVIGTDMHLRVASTREMEETVERLRRRILIKGGGRTNIYEISYNDTERAQAVAVVQRLVNTFVNDSLQGNRIDSSNAQRFLEERIREHEDRLTAAEQDLAEFKKEHVGLMPGEEGDYYVRLQTAMRELELTAAQYQEAVERRDQLLRQLEGEEAVFGLMQSPSNSGGSASPLDARIEEYQLQIDDLRLQFTDRHPDIVALQATIEQLEARRAEEFAANPTPTAYTPLDMNPVFQEMRIQLSNAELEVTTLRGRRAHQRSRVDELRRAVDTIPEVEAQLARLNRDYGVTKAQYEKLLQRLEAGRLREEAEQTTDEIKFTVIDPPAASARPVAPNRPLFLTIVLVAALGAGVALGIFQHQIAPVFNSRRTLQSVTRLPVLGTVSVVQSAGQRIRVRSKSALFVASVVMLVLAYAASVVFESSGVSLAQALLGEGEL